jgi:uncharacterized protein (DUF1800 family)
VSVERAITAIRFGTGRHPAMPDPTVADLLTALGGPDHLARHYPIEGFAGLGATQRDLRDLAKQARLAGTDAAAKTAKAARRDIYRSERETQLSMLGMTLARWVETGDPMRERLTVFWADHFTTIGLGGLTRRAVSRYVEDAIRPHLTGRFSDLLRAAVTHPMMLLYLDQARSVGPHSQLAGNDPARGLNENLAREIMELHTLGVGGPYVQGDVRALAVVLAGLTVSGGLEFRFNQRMAEPGTKQFLGQSFGAAKPDLTDVHTALDVLANHPATARFVARKLAVHFVSDTPPAGLIAQMEAAFVRTNGQLMAVYEAMLSHEAALQAPLQKAKQPFDLVATTARALGVSGDWIATRGPRFILRQVVGPMRLMGQRWQEPNGPDGWPEDTEHWITPQGLAGRIDWAMDVRAKIGRDLPNDPRAFLNDALGPLASQRLMFAVGAAEQASDGIGLAIVSPEFQRR